MSKRLSHMEVLRGDRDVACSLCTTTVLHLQLPRSMQEQCLLLSIPFSLATVASCVLGLAHRSLVETSPVQLQHLAAAHELRSRRRMHPQKLINARSGHREGISRKGPSMLHLCVPLWTCALERLCVTLEHNQQRLYMCAG